ncbi:hypothetical protein KQX54_014607, partial [Cotesia glomerata]
DKVVLVAKTPTQALNNQGKYLNSSRPVGRRPSHYQQGNWSQARRHLPFRPNQRFQARQNQHPPKNAGPSTKTYKPKPQ